MPALTFPFWVTSDNHFRHGNILRYEPIRQTLPMPCDEYMIKRWQELVGPRDRLLNLGDLHVNRRAVPDFGQISSRLTGHCFMLDTGNHDYEPPSWYAGHGFPLIPEFSIEYRGWTVWFTHRPDDDGRLVGNPRTINVHGHVHSKTRKDRRLINVSVEATGFEPLWLPDLLDERIDELEA